MSMVGMDVQGVRTLASTFTKQADAINTVISTITSQLGGTQWVGQDATRFRNDWSGTHTHNLRAVITELQTAATNASKNAQEQEQASGH